AETGDEPVDVLYNVAGISGPVPAELESADWDEWDDVFRIMVQGPLRVLQAFLPRMGEGAKVINFSSQLAASTWPYGGYYAYSAAKAALNRLMRSVAIDLKERGVIVGLVHPGWVQTEMGGAGADITPAESAEGIRKVTADWTLDRSGDFLKWNGETHPW
ncbi:MAG: short-chain dehydrogenase, partial [Novosphingobium sp. 17-62-8]